MNTLGTYLIIGAVLFSLGLFGVLQRRNLIGMLISVELMLNGANVNFMAFNRFLAPDPTVGQIFTLFIMGLAAALSERRIISIIRGQGIPRTLADRHRERRKHSEDPIRGKERRRKQGKKARDHKFHDFAPHHSGSPERGVSFLVASSRLAVPG